MKFNPAGQFLRSTRSEIEADSHSVALNQRWQHRAVLLASIVAIFGAISFAPSALRAETVHVGLFFVEEDFQIPTPFGPIGSDRTFHPYQITNPFSDAILDGGLSGFTEEAVRERIVAEVDAAYRAVDTGDPATTLALMIHHGIVPPENPGRRLNVVLGSNDTAGDLSLGSARVGSFFNPFTFPDDTFPAYILMDHLDALPGVTFDTADKVFNNFAGTIAHEIGHIFGLQHVDVALDDPLPIMGTSSTGLTNQDRLTLRRFTDAPDSQRSGVSSTSLLITTIGEMSHVPEPSTWVLLTLGILVSGVAGRPRPSHRR